MAGLSPQGIFLSYRREDAAPYARLLQRELRERFPDVQVFIDLDSIEAGLPFAKVIHDAVNTCAVLVALVGRQWVKITGEEGRRRLDDPDDYVRFEVQTALERGVRVIPVLVDGAQPLLPQELPSGLQELAGLNAFELSYGRYDYDASKLLDLIQRVLAKAQEEAETREKDERLRQEVAARAAAREEAARQAEAAASKVPEDARVIAQRAESHRVSGRLDEALADLNRAVELSPDDAWIYASRARLFQESGRRDEALADFKRAFTLEPGLALADIGSSGLKSRASKPATAIRDVRREELIEILKRQGYRSHLDSSAYKLNRNPDFRIKFTTTGARFEVKNEQGRWLLVMTMLLTRHYLEALALIEGHPRTMLQAICASSVVKTGKKSSTSSKAPRYSGYWPGPSLQWLRQRNADLQA